MTLLLQELYREDPWRMLVCCILLNRTSRERVDSVVDDLFEKWPGCVNIAHADKDELTDLLKPLGLQNNRARVLIEFSYDWLVVTNEGKNLPSADAVLGMTGIGKYARDSYRIFVLGEASCESGDKELEAYLAGRGAFRALSAESDRVDRAPDAAR